MKPYETFVFESFEFDPKSGLAQFHYSLDEVLHFTEKWEFPVPENFKDSEALQEALFGLWIMAGISYYKAYIPNDLLIKNFVLSNSQADFFNTIYLHGLGEFFYENKIDPRGLIQFPFIQKNTSAENTSLSPPKSSSLTGTMIAVGGGKDSLTTIELLKAAPSPEIEPLSTWTVGHEDLFSGMREIIDLPNIQVERTICPNLIAENKKGALNGHVPFSAIFAFASVVSALIQGKKYIALSNEASANEANTEMYGMEINHQYSKSLEFEQDFQSYVLANISTEVKYFSFLRPLKEIQIAQFFCSIGFKKYLGNFSSCNRNFRITGNKEAKFKWCCECPKCAFIGCIFAPYLERSEMKSLFGCEIFKQEAILKFIPELLGQSEHKPFECVGEYEEVQYAINEAVKSGKWEELKPFESPISPISSFNPSPSLMPNFFLDILNERTKNIDK